MSEGTITPLTLSGFEVAPAVNGQSLDLVLRGNADMTVSSALKSYLKEVDDVARRQGIRHVEVKLGELYFLSSSCFQALASWLLAVASRSAESRYKVNFETHAARDWQRRSLEAIRRMAPAVVTVV